MGKNRNLIEQTTVSTDSGATLRIDREAGIIYGVRVLGRFSKNSHEAADAVNGTEYPPETQKQALHLINEQTVRTDHPPREKPNMSRSVFDTFGVLRNARLETRDGQEGTVADLHYYKTHSLSEQVLEDVERKLGRYGLSINAYSAGEHIDKQTGRLVIEKIESVVGVDLVDKPATCRNLFESHQLPPEKKAVKTKKITIRSLFEAMLKKPVRKGGLTPARNKWAKRLLEMDDSVPVDVSAEVPEEGADADDPDKMLQAGFRAAVIAVLDSDTDIMSKVKKIKDLLTTEEKLLQQEEPAEPVQEEDDEEKKMLEADEEDDKEKKPKTESQKGKKPAGKSILESEEKKELDLLRRKEKVRSLCESLSFTPSNSVMKALLALDNDSDRKEMIEEAKASKTQGNPGQTPRSNGYTKLLESSGTGSGSAKPMSIADEISALRNGSI